MLEPDARQKREQIDFRSEWLIFELRCGKINDTHMDTIFLRYCELGDI